MLRFKLFFGVFLLALLSVLSFPQTVIKVDPKGRGDFASLKDAIEACPPGSTIEIATGVYYQTEPLLVTKPLRLVGEGAEATIIVGDQGEFLLKIETSGPFYMEGISFKYDGSGPADVVVVDADELKVVSCSFSGAVQAPSRLSWAGLMIKGNTRGVVESCVATENTGEGITIGENAAIEVRSCTCSDNTGVGIAFIGFAEGIAENNICERNGQAGICVGEQASPEVRNNQFLNNKAGVWVFQNASPTLANNVFQNNEIGIFYWLGAPSGISSGNRCDGNSVGILVAGTADPELVGNICVENEVAGIVFSESSLGSARENRCESNGIGILISDEAQPDLEGNICSENTRSGIVYVEQAGGSAVGNICEGNGRYGIEVRGQAQPTLERNTCTANSNSGIAFLEKSSGTVSGNTCNQNGADIDDVETLPALVLACLGVGHGIFVSDQATPLLRDGECKRNAYSGLFVSGDAKITVENAVFAENVGPGVMVLETGSVTLMSCVVSKNGGCGIEGYEESDIDIISCEVSENIHDGISFSGATLSVAGSRVWGNTLSGCYLKGSCKVTIEESVVFRNVHGVEAADSADVSISASMLKQNRYTGAVFRNLAMSRVEFTTLEQNFIGLLVQTASQVLLSNCLVANNGSGIAVEDEGRTVLERTKIQENTGYAVLLLGNASLALDRTTFSGNGLNDVLLGDDIYGLHAGELSVEIKAHGAQLRMPNSPSETVRQAVDAIVEVWPYGYDEETGNYWEFAANGVVACPGIVITVAHVFYGEDTTNPEIWLRLTALEVVDADKQLPILTLDDMKLGATGHGPHPAALDHSRDVAVLYPKGDIPMDCLTVSPSLTYGSLVWAVGYVGYMGTGEIWRFIPGFVSIPSREYIVLSLEAWLKNGKQRTFLPDVFIRVSEGASTAQGMSGSPVLTPSGELVGILMRGVLMGGLGAARATDLPKLKPLESSGQGG